MNSESPDKAYGPQIANLMQKLCEAIGKESGATGIKVEAEFRFRKGRGELTIKTFTTPDTKTERMLDPNVPMPRGSKLAHDAMVAIRKVLLKVEIAAQLDMEHRLADFERLAKALLEGTSKLPLEQKVEQWEKILPLLYPPAS